MPKSHSRHRRPALFEHPYPAKEQTVVKNKTRWTFTSHHLSSSYRNIDLGVTPLSPQQPNNQNKRKEPSQSIWGEKDIAPLHFPSGRKVKKREINDYYPFIESQRKVKRGKRKAEIDYFSMLPDEMVMGVLSFVGRQSLGRLACVSTRFSRLIKDPSLWRKIDCLGLTLSHVQTEVVLGRAPEILRMARATVTGTILKLPPFIPLTLVDFTMSLVEPSILSQIFTSCRYIQKLSLEHLRVPKAVIQSLRGCQQSLRVLNLAMCYDVEPESLADLLRGCSGLSTLNLSCQSTTTPARGWNEAELMSVIASLPVKIEQLNLSGFRYTMKDAHTHLLSARFSNSTNLIDLDLSDSQELTRSTIEHLLSLQTLQHLSLTRCYSIDPMAYHLLASLKSLRYLEVFSLFKESGIKSLKSALTSIEVNKFPFSAIARPTVGDKRSSIWGVRVRE